MGKLLHALLGGDGTCDPGNGLGSECCPHGLGLVRTSPGRMPVGQQSDYKQYVERQSFAEILLHCKKKKTLISCKTCAAC